MNEITLQCENLCKQYHDGSQIVPVLNNVDLTVKKGERLAIIGPSGSGKSTLLHLLGGLDLATNGRVFINGLDWQQLSEKKRCHLRNRHLGFVYQFHHLLPEFTALENVAMPLLLAGNSLQAAQKDAQNVLDAVGLANRLEHKPSQLSGGERQRVAIARALVHKPACLLADEPTGNLDQETATKVFSLMLRLNEQFDTALIIVTHDKALAQKADRTLLLNHGTLEDNVI